MKKMTILLAVLAAVNLLCTDADSTPKNAQMPKGHPVPKGQMVGEVISATVAGNYTYVELKTRDGNVWVAASKCNAKTGETVMVPTDMPMKNFTSKALERKFELIYFTGEIGAPGPDAAVQAAHGPMKNRDVTAPEDMDFSNLKKAKKGYTVADLYAKKDKLSGKKVKMRGKVVKVNNGIMGKNWVHVQDGTGDKGTRDMLVTTQSKVEKGQTILVEGTLSLDQDFGMGYKYSVMVTDGAITVE